MFRYSGDLLNDGELEKSVQGGLGARLFVKLVIWLGEQFEKVCKVEEKMHPLGGKTKPSAGAPKNLFR